MKDQSLRGKKKLFYLQSLFSFLIFGVTQILSSSRYKFECVLSIHKSKIKKEHILDFYIKLLT